MKNLRSLFAVPALLALLTACGPTIGDPCTTSQECGGQVCLNRGESTPGGYCSRQCTQADLTTCPGGSICVRDGLVRGTAACYRQCRTQADCRPGYVCRLYNDSLETVCAGP